MPRGLPGADDEALVPAYEPDGSQAASRDHLVEIAQPVLACGGVEQMDRSDMAKPVPERFQTPERACARNGECQAGVTRAQPRRGKIERRVVRPHHDDGALDLPQIPQEPDLDLAPGLMTLAPSRYLQKPVGSHERGQHSCAPRERRSHEPAAHAAEADTDPLVKVFLRSDLAWPSRACTSGRPCSKLAWRRPRRGAANTSKLSAAETG